MLNIFHCLRYIDIRYIDIRYIDIRYIAISVEPNIEVGGILQSA